MIQNKTRIRITWAFVIMCLLGMILGWDMNDANVVMSSLGSCSLVVMSYVAGKTINNQKQINEKSNSNSDRIS